MRHDIMTTGEVVLTMHRCGQVDSEPSIRANTTVLLGNIAHFLGAAACKRILLNAFTRALRDVFPPSRIAALKALMATAPFHSPQDVASRVVPCLSPMMLDTTAEVRQIACKVRSLFLAIGVRLETVPPYIVHKQDVTSLWKMNSLRAVPDLTKAGF
jgi:hypothetical protein